MQEQVNRTFDRLWNDLYGTNQYSDEDLGIHNDNGKLFDWSEGLITSWFQEALARKTHLSILDAGCGGGYGFKSILELNKNHFSSLEKLEYVGIDLIDLDQTKERLEAFIGSVLPRTNFSIRLINADMNEISFPNKFDVVMALGSLHHTPSVQSALQSTYGNLKPLGMYIGWIINTQKPLRRVTDSFFREFFNDTSQKMFHEKDLTSLAYIFKTLGEALEDKMISIDEKVSCLDLDPGTYRLQNLLYDYFFKCYFRGGNLDEGLPRVKAQLFDWFVPKYYHQTTRMELCSMIDMLGGSSDKEIISKTNGHFFKIINQHC